MAFDGIVTKALVRELNHTILNTRIEKIYVPNSYELFLFLHGNKNKYKLLISVHPVNGRIQLTKQTRENPEKAPQFCMVLRKHLQGAKIVKIEQHELDRIVEFTFENLNELGDLVSKKIIVEIMGKHSNIILLNDTQKIIDSMHHIDSSISSLREILPARTYEYPTNQDRNLFQLNSYHEFKESMQEVFMRPSKDGTPFSTTLANHYVGFSRRFTQNICQLVQIDQEVTSTQLNKLYTTFTMLFHQIEQGLATLIYYEKDYHFDLINFFTQEQSNTPLSDFLDQFYIKKEQSELIHTKKFELQRDVLNLVYKIEKKLDHVHNVLSEADEAEKYKQYGELISSNIYRMTSRMNELVVEDFFHNNKQITIPLNENKSPAANAQIYFKKYTKLKNAIRHATSQEEEYTNLLNYLETVLFQIGECTSKEEINEIKKELIQEGVHKSNTIKKEKTNISISSPLRYEYEGVEILVGKNNLQNDQLTLKIAKKTDTWLHTKDIHGSHVIIRSDQVSDSLLFYAAKLAVEHSKAKGSSKVPVDYTQVKYVRKPSGSKPGMVIYTNYKTILI